MNVNSQELLDDPVEWGRVLIRTEDHDPLYSALFKWKDEVGQFRVERFMLAYWFCYSVGASWRISQSTGEGFWDWLGIAAENVSGPKLLKVGPTERWPRAGERRHWRGQKAVDSIERMRESFPDPNAALSFLLRADPPVTLKSFERKITTWPQFGPWMAFKAADMMERIFDFPVIFPNDVTTLYRDPKKGAEMAGPLMGNRSPQEVTEALLAAYAGETVPGNRNRSVNVQEVETVLCKWKSARRGKYRIGHDTAAHRTELAAWGGIDLLGHYPIVTR